MIDSRLRLVLSGPLCFAPMAYAHPGHAQEAGGVLAGLLHPLTGIDHVAFMAALGAWIVLTLIALGLLLWRPRISTCALGASESARRCARFLGVTLASGGLWWLLLG